MRFRFLHRIPRPRPAVRTALAAVTAPDRFFAERPAPSVRRAAGIVVLVGLASALPAAAVNAQFAPLMPAWLFVAWMLGVTAVIVLYVLALWLAFAAALYALSYPVSGRGGGRRLLASVGWGLLPEALAALVVFGAMVVATSQTGHPTGDAVEEFLRRVDRQPLVALSSVAGTSQVVATGTMHRIQQAAGSVAILWSGAIWVHAVRHARGLARRPAVVVVAIAVAAQLAWHLGLL